MHTNTHHHPRSYLTVGLVLLMHPWEHQCCSIFLEFDIFVFHPIPFLLLNPSPSLSAFFVACSAGISAGGGSDCSPPTCSVLEAPTDRALSVSLMCWSGLISAAIRAAKGRWWEAYVCVCVRESVVGDKTGVGDSYKQQRYRKAQVFSGWGRESRAGAVIIYFLFVEMQICQMLCE